MLSISSWRTPGGLLLALCVCFALGCGNSNKERAKVKGRVKFFDKYLTCGTVTFTAKDGRIGAATIDFDGNYEMGDAPIGDVTVTVKVPTPAAGPRMSGKPKPPPGVPAAQMPGSEDDKTSVPMIDPSKIVAIPGKYGSVDSSPLKYTVEKGEQTHNITLSP